MQSLLTTKQVTDYFKVKPSTVTQKFIKMGLKVIPIGNRDYRFDTKDVEDFVEHLKKSSQEKIMQKNHISIKHKSKSIHVDFEKIRINRELNRVV